MKWFRTKQAVYLMILLAFGSTRLFAVVPAVLQQMPKDAVVVVTSQRLDELGKKLDTFAKTVGLGAADKPFNIEEMIAGQTGITGLDQTQAAGFAVVGMPPAVNPVFFLPVTDSQAVLNSAHAQKSPENPTLWLIPNPKTGQNACASPFGKYLCIAENPETLASMSSMPRGVALSDPAKEVFEACDIIAKINLEAVMPMMQGVISGQMMNNPAMQQNPAQMQIMKAYMDRLGELHELAIGAQIAPQTILFQSAVQAKPGTKLAQYMANQPASGIQDLAALPDQPFNFVMSMNLSKEVIQLIANEILASAVANPQTGATFTAQNAEQVKSLLPAMVTGRGPMA